MELKSVDREVITKKIVRNRYRNTSANGYQLKLKFQTTDCILFI